MDKLGTYISWREPAYRSGIRILLLQSLLVLSLVTVAQPQQRLDSLLQVAEQEQDPQLKAQKQLAYLYSLMSYHPDSALMLIDKLIAEYDAEQFEFGLARALSMKSWLITFQLEYEQAHMLAHQALEMQQKDGRDSAGIALTLNRIGIVNLHFERIEEAEDYMTQALEYFTLLEDTVYIDMCLNNLGIVALQKKDYQVAIRNYKQSLAIRLNRKMWHWAAFAYYNIGSLYTEQAKVDSAQHYLDLSVNTFLTKTLAKRIPPMVYLGLAELAYAKKNWGDALKYAEISLDSATYLKRKESDLAAKEFIPGVHYQIQDYQRAYETLLEFQAEKSLRDSLNNEAEVSEVEEKYQNVQKEKELVELRANELEAANKIQEFRLLLLSVSIAGALMLAVFLYFFRRKRQQQRWIEADLQAKISEMKLTALRSQMNPHFIFNCINTAQNFVLRSQKEDAYDYLSRFAKLLRVVLEHSDQTYISIEDEIHHLQLYIELEAIRFDGQFEYRFEVDEAIQGGIYEIPTMILQPFVENAILHGLINRSQGGGLLTVEVLKEHDILHCTIEDNGVGREKAAEIKRQKERFYQGTALPNVRERLAIIEEETGLPLNLTITDLSDGNKAAGTRVSLSLPLR
ncbi:MAG: histidine kinase [Bacteroidia bacterium]|nr:histidine kinase [Bacteroidia bacterium]